MSPVTHTHGRQRSLGLTTRLRLSRSGRRLTGTVYADFEAEAMDGPSTTRKAFAVDLAPSYQYQGGVR
jgi:hypothetical protein